ncbi:MAG TPA: YbaB/EbfC family nucleoid-associated protein, partial [Planctomycetota bacterium]|nr:YbaB/EbfC family nucleoid-associated protein [Planctomycetota bacterium]
QDMQKRLAKVEEDLKERIVEATAGGGMVNVKISGTEEVVAIKIDEQVLSDRAMVEDLVMAAMNEGIRKAKKLRETEMVKVTGVSMPGMF